MKDSYLINVNHFKHLAIILFSMFFLTACPVKDAVTVLDEAIEKLDQNSQEWQNILQVAIAQIPADVADETSQIIRNELSDLLSRTIAAAGAEARCTSDFIGNRVHLALTRLRGRVVYDETVEELPPHFCSVIPSVLRRKDIPDSVDVLEVFGFDFDKSPITVYLEDSDGETWDVTEQVDMPTHYVMTINLGAGGLELDAFSKRLVFFANGEELYSVAVIQEVERTRIPPLGTMTFVPQHVFGDREFNGNGPEVWCSVDLRIVNNDTQLEAFIFMRARETKSDWTEAQGKTTRIVYTAPEGKIIKNIVGTPYTDHYYLDDDDDLDVFELGNFGPVQRLEFIGDSSGDDAGISTQVEITFNDIYLDIF